MKQLDVQSVFAITHLQPSTTTALVACKQMSCTSRYVPERHSLCVPCCRLCMLFMLHTAYICLPEVTAVSSELRQQIGCDFGRLICRSRVSPMSSLRLKVTSASKTETQRRRLWLPFAGAQI